MSDPIRELAETISMQGGQADAIAAVVLALCQHIHPDSALANAIRDNLERAYSTRLQDSKNQAYFEGFESTMETVKAALLEQPDGCTS